MLDHFEGFADERAYWESRSPIIRFGKYLSAKGWWTAEREEELRALKLELKEVPS